MRKSVLLLGALSFAGIAGTAWFGHSWWVESRRVDELARELARLSALQTVPSGREVPAVHTPSREMASDQKPAATADSPAVAAPVSAAPADGNAYVQNWQQREKEMLRDPAYRQSQIAEWRRRLASARRDAIRVAGMTPEQADRMIDLWAERNLRFMELGAAGGQPPSADVQAELKRAGEAEQAELRRVLGAETLARWQRYLESGDERAEVGQFRAQLSHPAKPLTDEQADALVEAIYSERRRRSAEYEAYVAQAGITDRYSVAPQDRQRWLDLEKEANARIHSAMAASLTRAQLESLDESLAARLAPVEAALRMQLEGRSAKAD